MTTFLDLHVPGSPLLLGNVWDAGTAKSLAFLGYQALATTSGGHAATLGRQDGTIQRDEALAHAAEIVAASPVPVSADLEHGFGTTPEEVAETIRLARATGLAGASIEDFDRDHGAVFDLGLARERIAAAADAAHTGPSPLVLTARAENFFRGITDLDDTITRLQAYAEAGADVLYAPAIIDRADLARVVSSVDRPVNVLAIPGVPPVAELAEIGVARVSVGTGFSLAAYGALATAATELLEHGTYAFWDAAAAAGAVRGAFDS